jgi:hypothetical protein
VTLRIGHAFSLALVLFSILITLWEFRDEVSRPRFQSMDRIL